MVPNPRVDDHDFPPDCESTEIVVKATQCEAYGTAIRVVTEPLPCRPSVYRHKSFIAYFVHSNGPPQIIILVVLLAVGLGSVIGVVPAVMTDRYARIAHGYSGEKSCSDYSPTERPQACLDGSSDAQNAVAMEQFISNGLTFFTCSLVGSLSDEYGRKWILLIGVLMATLSPLFLLLIQLNPEMNPLWYYVVGALQGLISWPAVALSALADVMPRQWRAPSFGMVLAGFSVGFATAPQLALFLGHFYVTIFSFSVVLMAFFVMLIFIPETLPPGAGIRAELSRIAEVEDLPAMQKFLWYLFRPLRDLSILNRSNLFRLLAALAFFSAISSSGDRSLILYYVEEKYGFKDAEVAVYFLIVGFCGIFVQGVLLKIANDKLGERRVVIFSFLVGTVHDVLYCVAKTKTGIYVGATLASLLMMSFPTISAIKSNNVNESEQGRIQGALSSVQALASAMGPTLFRLVYVFARGLGLGTGSMFLFSALMYAVATYCAYLLPPEANSAPEEASEEGDTLGENSFSPSSTSEEISSEEINQNSPLL